MTGTSIHFSPSEFVKKSWKTIFASFSRSSSVTFSPFLRPKENSLSILIIPIIRVDFQHMEISKEHKDKEIKEQFEVEKLQQHSHLYSRAAFSWFKLAIYRAIRHYEDKGVKAERLYLTREDEDFLSINATADSVGNL